MALVYGHVVGPTIILQELLLSEYSLDSLIPLILAGNK